MKLYFAAASPYSAKVRMAALACGILLDQEIVDTNNPTPAFLAANPLGKIPTLVTEDGVAIFDSRAITQYLNRLSGGALWPSDPAERTRADVLEAAADGLCDCLLAHVYERRSRPPEKVHQPWLDKQWQKAERMLDLVAAAPPELAARPQVGEIALRAALGYLSLRFNGQWEDRRPALIRWADGFDTAFPSLAPALPS